MKRLLLAACITLTACGSSEDSAPLPTTAETIYQDTTYLKTYRNPETSEWFAETGIGVFRTMTSARFTPGRNVTVITRTYDGAVMIRLLRGDGSILVCKL